MFLRRLKRESYVFTNKFHNLNQVLQLFNALQRCIVPITGQLEVLCVFCKVFALAVSTLIGKSRCIVEIHK